MYFATDDVHVAARVRVLLRQFILQKLQMQHNGVDRILDFLSHTASPAAAGRNAAGHIEPITHAAGPPDPSQDLQMTVLGGPPTTKNSGGPNTPPRKRARHPLPQPATP